MALDLEEQEQVEELKAWWKQHGGMIAAVVVAAAVGFAGWQGWRWYQGNQAAHASALYETLTKAVQANDAKALRDAAGTLVESYPRTLYASLGALVAARYYFDRNDPKNAKAQLAWVIEHAWSQDFKDLARLRLAAVQLDEKAYDEALKVLAAKPEPPFEWMFDDLRGDVLAAQGKGADARAAYQSAIGKGQLQDDAARERIQMKLDALGGG